MGFLGDIFSGKNRRAEESHQALMAKAKLDEQLRVLNAEKASRAQLDEIYQRFGGDPNDPTNKGDPKQLGMAIDDFAKAYQIETRQPLHPELVRALKDPKFGADLLKASSDQGATMGEVFKAGASPMMRLQGRLAIAKHMDTTEAQGAAARGDRPAAAPAPADTGPALGAGLTLPGAGPGGAAIAAPAQPVVDQGPPAAITPATGMPAALTPALQGAASTLQDRVNNLRDNIAIIARKDPKNTALPILNDQLKTAQEHLFKLTAGSAQGQAEAEAQLGRRPIPTQELRETGQPSGTLQRDRSPAGTLLTPQQQSGITHTAGAAGTELTDVIHQGVVARQTLPMLDVAMTAALKAGVMGPMVTPVKESMYKVGQLFGFNTEKLNAIQLIDAITPRLAIQLTSQMKGQQSDREFLAGVQSAANKGQTNQAFALVAYVTQELAQLAIEKEVQARIWTANVEHPGLNLPDRQGRTFQQVFDASVEKINTDRGTIGERASRAFSVNYKDVLKGNITAGKGR